MRRRHGPPARPPIALLEGRPALPPVVTLNTAWSARIDDELEPLDRHRSWLYYG